MMKRLPAITCVGLLALAAGAGPAAIRRDSWEQRAGSGQYVAWAGSGSLMLSFLHPDGIESYSLVSWGQSGDDGSPHYLDQAEKLYAEPKFRPTWFRKEKLMKHVESEITLVVN